MAKSIILLETQPADGGVHTIRAVFWFAVPVARRIALPEFVSAWKGLSDPETAALRDGSVLEEVQTVRVPASSTKAEVQSTLLKVWTDRAAYLAALPNKIQFYGVFYDPGTGWSA